MVFRVGESKRAQSRTTPPDGMARSWQRKQYWSKSGATSVEKTGAVRAAGLTVRSSVEASGAVRVSTLADRTRSSSQRMQSHRGECEQNTGANTAAGSRRGSRPARCRPE